MKNFSVIEAPSILGLGPTGVEFLPDALKANGLVDKLHAGFAGRIIPPDYSSERDAITHILNPEAIRTFSLDLADKVIDELQNNRFPVVLGGDCSILIGNLLALRRLGRYGLFFLDGHADFYQPEASLSGQVADMDLAIATGRGPDILTDIDGLKPLVSDKGVSVFGYRDAEESAKYGSQDIRSTGMRVFSLADVLALGVRDATTLAVEHLTRRELNGFWIHLDADVLNDEIMPAVDYRLTGGLSFKELSDILQILMSSGRAVGIDITIFNPGLDDSGSIARRFADSIIAGLSSRT